MVAIELVTRPREPQAASAEAAAILMEARERGLLLIKAGLYDNVIRLLMPLVYPDRRGDGEGLDILETSLRRG